MIQSAIVVGPAQAQRLITNAIKAKVVPFLKGSPGIGKSQLVYQIAEKFNLQVIDLRLSQCDPTDLSGFPSIINGRADYLPMKHFPIEGDPLPPGKAGWIIFLDEATSAMPAVQAAAYKLVLDRMVGTHHLHPKVALVLAGNLETDGAIVHPMSTALESRLQHMQLEVSSKEWDEWATKKGLSHHITSFIKFKPSQLYTFSPDHTDCTYASPRTWEFADRLLGVTDDEDLLPTLSGTISEGVAREFLEFRRIYDRLPTFESILKNPTSVKVPDEPSILFALTGSIANGIMENNCSQLLEYIKRLPVEFQMVCLKESIRRNESLINSPAFQKWLHNSAVSLF